MRLPTHRQPTTPGEFLTEEFLKPMGLTQADLADHLGWTTTKVNQIARGLRAITPETALSLGEAFGVSPEFWLNAQRAVDLWKAKQEHKPVKLIVVNAATPKASVKKKKSAAKKAVAAKQPVRKAGKARA